MQGAQEAVDVGLRDDGGAGGFLIEDEIERTAVGKEPDAHFAGWILRAAELEAGEFAGANGKDAGIAARRQANPLYDKEQSPLSSVAL